MTLNNFLEAVAEKLVGLWPDRHVFVNEIPKDSDGNFFVGIIEATQEKKLDRRRRRHVQIEVLYFLASKDSPSTEEKSGGSGDASFAAHSHTLKSNYQTNTDAKSEYYYGLAVGDKVVLLRNAGGQAFLVLGRV